MCPLLYSPAAENLVPIRLDIEIDGQRLKDAFSWNPSGRIFNRESWFFSIYFSHLFERFLVVWWVGFGHSMFGVSDYNSFSRPQIEVTGLMMVRLELELF